MFDFHLVSAHHMRHYSIMRAAHHGWEVRFEEDQVLRRFNVYQDWHRVERVLASFNLEVAELIARGWEVAAVSR
jgi:hypothetical protein